jgi:hypothetical protein
VNLGDSIVGAVIMLKICQQSTQCQPLQSKDSAQLLR